jgi:3-hydroxyisobutyrate dehydrogenase-like beta-hydroxyacid dehydrogenase
MGPRGRATLRAGSPITVYNSSESIVRMPTFSQEASWPHRSCCTSAARFVDPDTEPVAFTTDGLMRKDLALDDDLATRLEVRMPVARVATSILEETIEHDLQKQTRLRYAC